MVLTLSFTVDWTSSLDRAQLAAPLVVRDVGASTQGVVAGDPTVALVDARRQVPVRLGPEREAEQVEAVDLTTATATRGVRAVRGDLGDLHGRTVAATESWLLDSGTGLGGSVRADFGGRPVKLRLVAVVPDAPDLYGDLLVPLDALPGRLREAPPSELFVTLRPGVPVPEADASLRRTLDGTGSRVLTAEEWIDDVAASTRRANNLGLVVLLGPAGLYAAIAIVNATLIGATQRRRQHELVHLLGATPDQVRRAAAWQAALVTGAGLLLGGLTTAFLGWLVRHAIARDLAGTGVDVPMTVPWLPLAAIAGTCGLLALAAALAGVRGHLSSGAPAVGAD
jgi:putative ABC transport system permease protein